jgi:hypothetical protein
MTLKSPPMFPSLTGCDQLTRCYTGEEMAHFLIGRRDYRRLETIFMFLSDNSGTGGRSIEVDGAVYHLKCYIDQEEVLGYHLTPKLNPYFIKNEINST